MLLTCTLCSHPVIKIFPNVRIELMMSGVFSARPALNGRVKTRMRTNRIQEMYPTEGTVVLHDLRTPAPSFRYQHIAVLTRIDL